MWMFGEHSSIIYMRKMQDSVGLKFMFTNSFVIIISVCLSRRNQISVGVFPAQPQGCTHCHSSTLQLFINAGGEVGGGGGTGRAASTKEEDY